jgi:hypothetical protein
MNPLKNTWVFELFPILSLFHSDIKYLVQSCVYYVVCQVHFWTMACYVYDAKNFKSWMGAWLLVAKGI